jgi:hypothetical protein
MPLTRELRERVLSNETVRGWIPSEHMSFTS